MVKKTDAVAVDVQVTVVSRGEVSYRILGTQPLIFNQINEKAKRELLLPSGRKTAADKQASFKHSPRDEFRQSIYRNEGDTRPTRLCFPTPGFKAAMGTAALDMPGTKKAQIGRLVWCEGYRVDIYGIPKLYMTPVRSADMARTPDIRTRAMLPRWACELTIRYAQPLLRGATITNLLAAAGMTVGVGDYRQEKGKGSYGQFDLVGDDNQEWLDIVQNEGREAQDLALELAETVDAESEDLLNWYDSEITRRTVDRKGGKLAVVTGEAA